jgi:Pentapeptide repeats (8 copies)
MISVQTFYFRGEKWLQFLKMINNYTDRIEFLTHFIVFVINENISLQELQDKIKGFSLEEYRKPNKKTLEIYNELIKINDEDFFTFLLKAAIPLLRIDKIENYLRILDTTKDIDTTEKRKIKSYECLDELKNGIESFNEYVQGSVIHLPYLALDEIQDKLELNLTGAHFSGANLFNANLTGDKLSGANLTGVDLSVLIFLTP